MIRFSDFTESRCEMENKIKIKNQIYILCRSVVTLQTRSGLMEKWQPLISGEELFKDNHSVIQNTDKDKILKYPNDILQLVSVFTPKAF